MLANALPSKDISSACYTTGKASAKYLTSSRNKPHRLTFKLEEEQKPI